MRDLTYIFVVCIDGGRQYTQQKCTTTGRAGGARADDNFTKKPQKKLIRYMVVFWGFSTKRVLFWKRGGKISEKSGNFPN